MARAEDIPWRGERVCRLVLGTAQLGMDYGIANALGRPSQDQAHDLVAEAWRQGIRTFDTAQAYGDSEAVLGDALAALGVREQARVITKLSPDLDPCDEPALAEAVDASCRRLGLGTVWGLMLHRGEWLARWGGGLGRFLCRLREQGRVRYLGVSVYAADAARAALEHPDIDMIQVPCNVWDTRLLDSGVFALARRVDKLCFVRSVYLQGLLVLPPRRVRERLPAAAGLAERWHQLAASLGTSARDLAIRFALSLGVPLVVGAETLAQVRENAALLERPPLSVERARQLRAELGSIGEDILDPTRWRVRA